MAGDHLQGLLTLRDQLVAERRNLVASILADPQTSSEVAGEFIGLQHFVDAVEKALSHEGALARSDAGGATRPPDQRRPS